MDGVSKNSEEITNGYTISTEKSEKKKTSIYLDVVAE